MGVRGYGLTKCRFVHGFAVLLLLCGGYLFAKLQHVSELPTIAMCRNTPKKVVLNDKDDRHITQKGVLHDRDDRHITQEGVLHDKDDRHITQEGVLHDKNDRHITQEGVLHDKNDRHITQEGVLHDKNDRHITQEGVLHDKDDRHITQQGVLHDKDDRHTSEKVLLPENDTEKPLNSTPTVTQIEDFVKYPCLPSIPISSKNACVRMFNDTTTDVPSNLPCVTLQTKYGSAPICTYDPKIDVVSRYIQKHGIWEFDLVYKWETLFRRQRDLQFLDIGCNIGTYTIAIASLGRRVVAVDALTENLQLLNKSLALGNLQKRVTLIWNGISDTRTTMSFAIPPHNVAATSLRQKGMEFKKTGRRFDVRSILLDDLIPILKGKHVAIKMDIEGHEFHALKGGVEFFQSVNVSLIQMEWKFHYQGGQELVDFLSTRGFEAAVDIEGRTSLMGMNISRWPEDVYFLKRKTGHVYL